MCAGSERLRRAATVIAGRPARHGLEVLVLRRSVHSRFLPGYVVFPGGAVDADDAGRAARWFGTPDEAARAAAVRELAEETGLVVTAEGVVAVADGDPLGVVDASPPRAFDLPEVSRWIAPSDVPVRFDARYYAVAAPPDLPPRPDGVEVAAAWWASPADLLRRWRDGEARLYWPTMKTMEAVARCRSVERLLSIRIPQEEPAKRDEDVMPRSTFVQGD